MVQIQKKKRGSLRWSLVQFVRTTLLAVGIFWIGLSSSRAWFLFLITKNSTSHPDHGVPSEKQILESPPEKQALEPPSIPHILFFTHKENVLNTKSPTLLYENVMNTADSYRAMWGEPDAKVQFLDDAACREKIKIVEPNLVSHFVKEKMGMYKADICRVAALFLMGGYYFDVDMKVVNPVRLLDNVTFATAYEAKPNVNFFQSFLASSPGHPILRETLRFMLGYYEGKHKLHGYMGTSTLRDGYYAVEPSERGGVHILQETNNVVGKEGYYPELPKQDGDGIGCQYIVHDSMERVVYFYSHMAGASAYCHMPRKKTE